jgi:hypothetical protein
LCVIFNYFNSNKKMSLNLLFILHKWNNLLCIHNDSKHTSKGQHHLEDLALNGRSIVKWALKKKGLCCVLCCIRLVHDVNVWWAVVNMVMDLWVSWKAENFLNSWAVISISKSILPAVCCNHTCTHDSNTDGITKYS